MKIIVLAGNRQEFEKYLDDNGMTDSQAVFGYEFNRMIGIEASKVVEVGTFYRKINAYELRRFANTRIRSEHSVDVNGNCNLGCC